METEELMDQMDRELQTTYHDKADSSLEKLVHGPEPTKTTEPKDLEDEPESMFPLISMKGNEWLLKKMSHAQRATIADIVHKAAL